MSEDRPQGTGVLVWEFEHLERAEHDGFEIEGVPPLGVYPRPIGTGDLL